METQQVYILVGSMIVANVGTILTVLISALKLAALFGKMRHQIDAHTKSLDSAHSKIRTIEMGSLDI